MTLSTGVLEGQALPRDPSDLPEGCVAPADLRGVSDMADGTGKPSWYWRDVASTCYRARRITTCRRSTDSSTRTIKCCDGERKSAVGEVGVP